MNESISERINPTTLGAVRELVMAIQSQKLPRMLSRGELEATVLQEVKVREAFGEPPIYEATVFISEELATLIASHSGPGLMDLTVVPRSPVADTVVEHKWA